MRKFFFLILLFSTAVVSMAMTTAERADSAYNAEDYRLAIELYNKAVAEDGVSAGIYYNLGNAYYRAGCWAVL